MFYLILYSELDDFKQLLRSFETCFTIMLNKFDFGKIKVKLVDICQSVIIVVQI